MHEAAEKLRFGGENKNYNELRDESMGTKATPLLEVNLVYFSIDFIHDYLLFLGLQTNLCKDYGFACKFLTLLAFTTLKSLPNQIQNLGWG